MRRLVFACGLVSIIACGGSRQIILPGAGGTTSTPLDTLVAAYPLADGQNIRVVELWRDATMSCHFVQVRDRETPHIHATHDLTVTVLRGNGQLHLRGASYVMRVGDSAIVPRGTPHYFVNESAAPAAAFVTFAPAYEGTDQVPVDR